MRVIPASSLEELDKEKYKVFLLIDITFNETHYRYTDCDIPLVYDSNRYEPYPFQISNITASTERLVDSIDLKLVELNQALGIAMKDNNIQGSEVIVYCAIIAENNAEDLDTTWTSISVEEGITFGRGAGTNPATSTWRLIPTDLPDNPPFYSNLKVEQYNGSDYIKIEEVESE